MSTRIGKINCITVDTPVTRSTAKAVLYALDYREREYNSELEHSQRIAKLLIFLNEYPVKTLDIWVSKSEKDDSDPNIYLQIYDNLNPDNISGAQSSIILTEQYPLINIIRSGGRMYTHALQILTEELLDIMECRLPLVIVGNADKCIVVKKCVLSNGDAPLVEGKQITTAAQLHEVISAAVKHIIS